MNRKTLALSPLLITSLLLPIPAHAAAKAGAKCPEVGKTENVGSKKFTCVKSGKKLVWNKGVAIPVKATPVSKWPIPSALPTSFENLYENRAGVAYAAWQNTAKAISQNSAKKPGIEITVGPNTTPWSRNHEEVISQVSKAFSKLALPKKLYIIFHNYSDIAWAEGKVKEILPPNEFEEWMRNENGVGSNCRAEIKDCLGGKQRASRDGSASILLMGVSNQVGMLVLNGASYGNLGAEEANKKGMVLAHEYIHTLQNAPFATTQNYDFSYRPPTWMWEGAATFFQDSVINSTSYENYMEYRKVSIGGYIEREGIKEALVTEFLDLKKWTMSAQHGGFNPDYSYQLGERIIEILVALKGPDAVQGFFDQMSQKNGFEAIFKNTFGIAYEDAIPIIAKTLAANWSAGL